MSKKRFILFKSFLAFITTIALTFSLMACTADLEQLVVDEAIESAQVVFASGDSITSVTRDLTLPTSFGDANITWTSSNPTVIANNGAVTRGFANVVVTLTATATYREASATAQFVVTVIGHDANALLAAIELTGENIEYDDELELYFVEGDFTIPASINGVPIAWESSIPTTLTTTGVVVRPDYGQASALVILIATINQIEREFEILVLAETEAPDPDMLILQQARDNLLIAGIGDGVATNITLATTVGVNNVAVTWQSSHPQYISSTGAVTRPLENTTVILTATLTYNEKSLTKVFEVVVLAAEEFIVVDNIAEAIAISYNTETDGVTRNYVLMENVTILGITGDGVVFFDDSGIMFAYTATRRNDLVIGGVYDVLGLTDRFFGSWQVGSATGRPVVFFESDGQPSVITPVVVGSITEMLENHHIPAPGDNNINYVYYQVTAKVLVQNALDNYGTVFVNADYDGPAIPTAPNSAHTDDGVIVYYHSNKAAFNAFHETVITFNILLYGYRSDRNIFSVLYLETVEDFQLTLPDNEVVDVVEATIKNDIAESYPDPTTITLRTALFGATISWASSHDDLIDPLTGEVTPPVGEQIEVTLTATIVKGIEQKEVEIKVLVGELPMLTIEQALAADSGTLVRFTGVVTGITTNRTFAIQDSTGAIVVYVPTADVDTWLARVGKTVEVIGTRGQYNGLQQVNPTQIIEGASTTLPAFTSIDGVPLTADDLLPFMSQRVSRSGLVITLIEELSWGNMRITFEDPDTEETIVMFWDSRVAVADNHLATLEVSDIINVVGAPLGWSNGPQLHYSSPSQFVVVEYIPETDEEKAALVANGLEFPEEIVLPTTLALPETGLYGTTITWASDNEAINVETGAVVLSAEPVLVTLTATIASNDYELEVTFGIMVGFVVITVQEARDAAVGDIVTIEALVTYTFLDSLGRAQTFFQDEAAGIYAFRIPATDADKVVAGNIVRITATRGAFGGQPQLVAPFSFVTIISEENAVVPFEVNAAEMTDYQGRYVTFEGYLVFAGGERTIHLADATGRTYGYFNVSDERAFLNDVPAGTKLTITTGVAFHSSVGAQLLILVPAEQIVIGAMGDRADLDAAALANLVLPEADNEVVADLTLPLTGFFGITVEWSSNDTDVITDAGVVTRPAAGQADAVVIMTYVVKSGEDTIATGEIVFTVLAEETVEEPGDETTYLETFGFVTESTGVYNSTGGYTDVNGFVWTYVARQNIGSLTLGNAADNNYIRVVAQGGISSFSVDLVRAFTNSNVRTVELFVNGISQGSFTVDPNSDTVQIFTIENIDIAGEVTIELRGTSPGTRGAIIVDNFSWTTYTPPAETTYLETFGFVTESTGVYNSTGGYTDVNGFVWTYVARQNIGSLTLGNAADNNYIRVVAQGGISSFSVDLVRAFTNSNVRTVELFVNGISQGSFTVDPNSDTVQIFTIENIDIAGEVTIELRGTSPGTRGAIIVDNFSWTTYAPPAEPNGD